MSRRGWMLFTTMSVIWGVPYLLIKVADSGVSVPVLVFARVGVGAALLLPIAARRRQLRELRPYWRWLAVFAFVEIIAPWFFLSDAERHLSSSLSGLLIASVPIIGAVLVRLTGGTDRLTPVRWAGLLLGLGGVALLIGPSANGGDWWSVTEALLTAVGYAIGPLIANRKLSDAPDLGVIAVCLTAALARRDAFGAGPGRAGRPGGGVHGGGVPAVLPAHRRGRSGARDRDHLRQSSGCRGPRRVGARRAADP